MEFREQAGSAYPINNPVMTHFLCASADPVVGHRRRRRRLMPLQDKACCRCADRSRAGRALLEIGVLDLDGDDPVVIHAMPRAKFRQFLG